MNVSQLRKHCMYTYINAVYINMCIVICINAHNDITSLFFVRSVVFYFPAPMRQTSLMISLQSYNYFLPHTQHSTVDCCCCNDNSIRKYQETYNLLKQLNLNLFVARGYLSQSDSSLSFLKSYLKSCVIVKQC